MLGRRWRAPVAWYIVENGSHLFQDAIALCKVATFLKWNPCALILSIATLHLLVNALLHFALEDTGSGRLVVIGYLEDVGCVDPVVGAAAHDMVAVDIALIHGDLSGSIRSAW